MARKSSWKDVGFARYWFIEHNGQFPWPTNGITIADPQMALVWAQAAKQVLPKPSDVRIKRTGRMYFGDSVRPLARILPNCGTPVRTTW